MAFTVRSLLPSVYPYRKDLEEERSVWAILETVKKICRQTMMNQEPIVSATVIGNPNVVLTPPSDSAIKRVHMVRIQVNGNYKNLSEFNENTFNNVTEFPGGVSGEPVSFSYSEENTIHLIPTPDKVYPLAAMVSLIPTGDAAVIPLPPEAEECITAGALSLILSLPGTLQNIAMSREQEVLHNRELSNLKAIALLGKSGRAVAYGPPFLRRNAVDPRRF